MNADDERDRDALRATWFAHLRIAVDDVEAVALDMLRKPFKRRLGPRKHRELYDAAASKLAFLLEHLPPDPGDDGPEARQRAAAIASLAVPAS